VFKDAIRKKNIDLKKGKKTLFTKQNRNLLAKIWLRKPKWTKTQSEMKFVSGCSIFLNNMRYTIHSRYKRTKLTTLLENELDH